MGERWRVWVRGEDGWRVVAEFASERCALTWSNGARLKGELLVLPDGADPRAPVRLKPNQPNHYKGKRMDTQGVAVRRGQAPLLRGRVF